MAKFSLRDNRFASPDIMWGEGSFYGHISIYGWSHKCAEMSALEKAASQAIANRIAVFLNQSEPSEAENAYESALAAEAGHAHLAPPQKEQ